MAARRPLFTESFSSNLTAIQTFLGPEKEAVFQQLLSRLFAIIVTELLHHVVDRNGGQARLAPDALERRVGGNAEEPGAERLGVAWAGVFAL